MRVDPEVCRRKYESELEKLRNQAEQLVRWGCWVVKTEFPTIDVIVLPRVPLRLSFVAPHQSTLFTGTGQVQLNWIELPMLGARPLGVRVGLDDYDQRAPSVTFHDPWTWELLAFDKMQRANNLDEKGTVSTVLLGDHPITKLPFLCMRGIREYHEHPQHTGDDWMLYRGGFSVFSLLMTVHRTCVQLAQPNLVYMPPNIQINWESVQARIP